MSITLGGSTEFNGAGDNTSTVYNVTLDIGTRTNGILIPAIVMTTPIVKTITAMSFDGVTIPNATSIQRNAAVGIEQYAGLFALSAPNNGSHTLSFTASIALATTELWYIAVGYWDGGHQTQASLIDLANSAGGSTDPSIALGTPAENNELVVSMYLSEANSVLTAGGGLALLQEHDFGPRVSGMSYVIQTTAASVTPAWTGVDDQWALVAASFRQAPAAGAVGPLIDGHLVKHGILQGRLARA